MSKDERPKAPRRKTVAERIQELLAEAPPLSGKQREELAKLLELTEEIPEPPEE